MPRLNAEQVAGYLYAAGFRGTGLATGIGIVLCESGGNTDAVGDGGRSLGMWQFFEPTRRALGMTDDCARDPLCSSRAAFQLSQGGTKFTDWSCFNNGGYRAHVPRTINVFGNTEIVSEGGGGFLSIVPDTILDIAGLGGDALNAAGDVISEVPDAAAATADAVLKLAEFFTRPENWWRLGFVGAGGTLLVIGVVLYVQDVTRGTPLGRFTRAG